MKLFIFLSAILLNCIHLNGKEADLFERLRLNQLLSPEDQCILAINPFLPNDFIGMGTSGKIDYQDWVYWGPKKVLEDYFKDEKSLSTPILRVKMAKNIKQKRFGVLEEKEFIDEVPKNIEKEIWFGSWGSYPFCLKNRLETSLSLHMLMAYVGLNHQSGAVLLFQLLTPKTLEKAHSAAELWVNFIYKTKERVEHSLVFPSLKILGREMHPGYTIIDIYGHKIKLIAERRKSDQKVLFASIPKPNDINTRFQFLMASLECISTEGHCKEPALKVFGTYTIDGKETTYSTTTFTLIKEVDEFTSVPNLKKNIFKLEQFFPIKSS